MTAVFVGRLAAGLALWLTGRRLVARARAGTRSRRLGRGRSSWTPPQIVSLVASVTSRWRRRRRDAEVAALVEAMARRLRAGSSPGEALRAAATSVGGDLGDRAMTVVARVGMGVPFARAMEDWARAERSADLDAMVAALAVGAASGGATAGVLDGLAHGLRDDHAVRAEVRALSSQARMSAWVISLAPLGFLAVAAVGDPRVVGFLVASPMGLAVLGAGLGLDAVGAWWMHRVAAIEL